MPVRLSYFDGMGFDYVLAGHFHTNFEVLRYEGGFFRLSRIAGVDHAPAKPGCGA